MVARMPWSARGRRNWRDGAQFRTGDGGRAGAGAQACTAGVSAAFAARCLGAAPVQRGYRSQAASAQHRGGEAADQQHLACRVAHIRIRLRTVIFAGAAAQPARPAGVGGARGLRDRRSGFAPMSPSQEPSPQSSRSLVASSHPPTAPGLPPARGSPWLSPAVVAAPAEGRAGRRRRLGQRGRRRQDLPRGRRLGRSRLPRPVRWTPRVALEGDQCRHAARACAATPAEALLQGLPEHVGYAARPVGPQPRLARRDRVAPAERVLAGQHFVEHAAQAEDVVARLAGRAGEHFGARVATGRGRWHLGGVGGTSGAEVEQPYRAVALQEDVPGLDVAVHDAALVRVTESGDAGDDDVAHEIAGERRAVRAPQRRLERLALEQFHRDEPGTLVAVEVEQARYGRVVEAQRLAILVLEARDRRLVIAPCGLEDLDRERRAAAAGAAAAQVGRAIDEARAAAADHGLEPIALAEARAGRRRLQCGLRRRRGRRMQLVGAVVVVDGGSGRARRALLDQPLQHRSCMRVHVGNRGGARRWSPKRDRMAHRARKY
ncbi:MAG: hypothetical protein U1F11_02910 [Steroidobacteraceae bacterium]